MNIKDVIKKSIESTDHLFGGNGHYNLIIVMEELNELGQQVSKVLRNKMDKEHLVEEVADVIIALEYVKTICHISDNELDDAIHYKLKRLDDTINSKGMFQ